MKLRFALMTLLLSVLVLSACGAQGAPVPADPLDAVKKIADVQKDIKTENLSVQIDLGIKAEGLPTDNPAANFLKDFKASLIITGDIDLVKQDFALNGKLDLGELNALAKLQGIDKLEGELVKIGDKLYYKIAGQDWTATDAKLSTDMAATPEPNKPQISAQQLTDLLKKASKAEKLADEKIDNVDTYHYKVTLDPMTMLTEIATLAQSAGAESVPQAQLDEAKKFLKDSAVIVEVWVGQQDLFIRQQTIVFTLSVTEIPDQPGAKANVNLGLTMKTSKINEPVTITAPK